jgi:RNA polymerase sigma-70 factor (ECF subfamily)
VPVVTSSNLVPCYDEGLEASFGRAALKKALEKLSKEQIETLQLHFFEGYTFEEIAVRLETSCGNVRNHYYRGLQKLRKHAVPR